LADTRREHAGAEFDDDAFRGGGGFFFQRGKRGGPRRGRMRAQGKLRPVGLRR
jgi:hypothetical protein